jgi:hypothetical protein
MKKKQYKKPLCEVVSCGKTFLLPNSYDPVNNSGLIHYDPNPIPATDGD